MVDIDTKEGILPCKAPVYTIYLHGPFSIKERKPYLHGNKRLVASRLELAEASQFEGGTGFGYSAVDHGEHGIHLLWSCGICVFELPAIGRQNPGWFEALLY